MNQLMPLATLPLPVPWRDPHTVPRELLQGHIQSLEQACADNPHSADLWTCLGMAYAMGFRIHPSLHALQTARDLQPSHFWAQFKYAELNYRLRCLPYAEEQTLRALQLASTPLEYNASRRQLQEIRRLIREGTQKPAWIKSLRIPALAALGLTLLLFLSYVRS